MAEAEDKVSASFACQKCLQPIVLDDSLDNISVHAMAELTLPIYSCNQQDHHQDHNHASAVSQDLSYDHYVPPFRLSDSTTGFMLVTDGRETNIVSPELKRKAELFDYLSSNSDIDHPLCDECTDWLLELMDRQLKLAENEWNDYSKYLKALEENQEIPNLEELKKELVDLNDEEKRLLVELKELKISEKSIEDSILKEEEKQNQLLEQENIYWREFTKHKRDLMLTEDVNRSLKCQIEHAESLLKKLKDTNVFNITFHIWHAGYFGTINNFRLGRLPSAPVDWSEINTAWGQTALLICALARKIGLTFKKYKIVPFGNHSYVEVLGENKELPLYCTGGFKFLWDGNFDAAMVAFLECLSQFQEEIKKRDTEFRLPYDMDKGKIIDPSNRTSYSIKIQFNSEEQWTKALKFMLTNLKWGLAWVSSQF